MATPPPSIAIMLKWARELKRLVQMNRSVWGCNMRGLSEKRRG
jgi:hypothetical protein